MWCRKLAKYGTFKYGTARFGGEYLFIFDRTQADLLNNTFKAYINYTDLNRIENRIKELSKALNSYAYAQTCAVKEWTAQKSTQTLQNFPLKLRDMERIRTNIKRLITQYYLFSDSPALPENLEFMNIDKMNRLEKILCDINELIKLMKCNFRKCGTIKCGGTL